MVSTYSINFASNSRIADGLGAWEGACDLDIGNWPTADKFQLAISVLCTAAHGNCASEVKLQFQRDGGAWTDVGAAASGAEIECEAGLGDPGDSGCQVHAATHLIGCPPGIDETIAAATYEQFTFGLDPGNAKGGSQYTFRLWDVGDASAVGGTAAAELTILILPGSDELYARFVVQVGLSSGSAELLGRAIITRSEELLGRAVITRAEELLGRAVITRSAELLGRFDCCNLGMAQLLGRAVITRSEELLGRAVITRSAELLGRFDCCNLGMAQLLGRAVITRSEELLGRAVITHSEELLGRFSIGLTSDSAELLGRAVITHSVELLARAVITRSEELLARVVITRSVELLGTFCLPIGVELLGKFVVTHSEELLARAVITRSVELLGRAVITHSEELLGRAIITRSEELLARAIITRSIELFSKFVVGQSSEDLFSKLSIGALADSVELLAIFFARPVSIGNYENPFDYTEVDVPANRIRRLDAVQVNIVDLDRDETCYLYRDMGAGASGTVYEFKFSIRCGAGPGRVSYVAWQDTLGDLTDCQNATAVRIEEAAQDRISLVKKEGGAYATDDWAYVVGNWYYLWFTRVGADLELRIYSDALYQNLVGTLNLVMGNGATTYRYLMFVTSEDTGAGGQAIQAYIKDWLIYTNQTSDLLCLLTIPTDGTPRELFSKFVVGWDTQDLLSHAEIQQETTAELLGRFEIPGEYWLGAWQRRKQHRVDGSVVGPLSNYQVQVTVHQGSGADNNDDIYCDGACQADFGDIRFTSWDGITEIDYWMQEKTDGVSAIFWVEVPRIPASPASVAIYVYYGTTGVSTTTSNGPNTFPFFDTFPGVVLDPAKWDEIENDGTAVVAGGTLTLTCPVPGAGWNGERVRTDNAYGNNICIRTRGKWTLVPDAASEPAFVYHTAYEDAENHWNLLFSGDGTQPNDRQTTVKEEENDVVTNWDINNNNYDGVYHLVDLKVFPLSCDVLFDGASWRVEAHSDLYFDDMMIDLWARCHANALGPTVYELDWVFIRNCVTTEPTHGTWYTEEGRVSEELLGRAAITHSEELLGRAVITHSEELLGRVVIAHTATPIELLAKLTVLASWLNTNWMYRKHHLIKGTAAGAQTDYQIGIKVYYAAGADGTEAVGGTTFGKVYCDSKCETDFADIRFTAADGVTELDYLIQKKTDGNNALIWVKVPSIPASPYYAAIFIYYGNSFVSTTEDGDATFEFFEDFEVEANGDLPSNWNVTEETANGVRVSTTLAHRGSKSLRIYSTNGQTDNARKLIPKTVYENWTNWALHYAFYPHLYNVNGHGSGIAHYDARGVQAVWMALHDEDLKYYADAAYNKIDDAPAGSWYEVETHVKTGTDTIDVWFDGVQRVNEGNLRNAVAEVSQIGTLGWKNQPAWRTYLDIIFIRKFANPDPTHSTWGSEESISANLFAKFIVPPHSQDLFSRFEVLQDYEDLYCRLIVARYLANWLKDSDNPLVDPGDNRVWPAIEWNAGRFHLFLGSYLAASDIKYYTSVDGENFTEHASSPVITRAQVKSAWDLPTDVDALEAHSIIWWNGQWRMYFGAQYNFDAKWRIGYADSTDFITWVIGNQAVLVPDQVWETSNTADPHAVVINGLVYIFYAGSQLAGGWATGVASSSDGHEFVKSISNPILADSAPISFKAIGNGATGLMMDRTVATYPYDAYFTIDGVTLIAYAVNPVLTRDVGHAWESVSLGHGDICLVGSEYWLYYVGQDGGANFVLGRAGNEVGSNDLYAKFEIGTGLTGSAELLGKLCLPIGVELLGKFVVTHSEELLGRAVITRSEELLGRAVITHSVELLARAIITRAEELLGRAVITHSAELLAKFNVGVLSGSAELLGRAEIAHIAIPTELLGRVEIAHTATPTELLGRAEITHSAELLAKFDVGVLSGSAELLGRAVITRAVELLGRAVITHSVELLGRFQITSSEELLARFELTSSEELLGRAVITHSEELLGRAVITRAVELLARFELTSSEELFGKFSLSTPATLFAKFEITHSQELLGRVVITHSEELLGRAVITRSVELLARVVITRSVELLGRAIITRSEELLAKAEITHSVELLGRAVITRAAELLGKFCLPIGVELLGKFQVTHSENLLALVDITHSEELLGRAVITRSEELLGRANITHSEELLGRAVITRSVELLGRAVITHSVELLSKFCLPIAQELFARAVITRSIALFSKFVVGQGAADLYARIAVGQDFVDFFAKFVVGQDSIDFLGRAIIQHPNAVDLLSQLYIRPTESTAVEMILGGRDRRLDIGGVDREMVIGGRRRRMKIR